MDGSRSGQGWGELTPGEVLDQLYRVDALIGRGAMGSIWAAQELERGGRVAIKILSPDLVEDRDMARFQREARLAAEVDQHDGVVRVKAFGEVRGQPYCVMELVDGEDLERTLRGGRRSQGELCTLLEQVARTLAHCHANGVVHRDLKPANIIVTSDGGAKVADFGLARSLQRSDRLTKTGELSGTPAYMAPEQAIDSARAVDPRVDVYSLGAILYEILTGRPPFVGGVLKVLDQVAHAEPEPPSAISPDVPPELEAICLRAMAKRPEDRFASALELADALGAFLRGEGVVRPRRHLAPTLAVLVALVTLAAFVATFRGGGAEPAERVARFDAFDGQDCADPPGTCPTGEHILVNYGLGLGPGRPPTDAELVEHEQALLGVGPGPEHENARRALARIAAHRRRLSKGQQAPAERDPTQLLVTAVQLTEQGYFVRAREVLARRRWGKGPRAAARVWVAAWRSCATDSDLALARQCLTERVFPLPALDPERRLVMDFCALVGAQWVSGRLQHAIAAGDPRGIEEALAELARGLCPRWPDSARQEMWAASRRAGVDAARETWSAALQSALALDAAGRRRALKQLFRCLGAALKADPPVESPVLVRALQDVVDRVPNPEGPFDPSHYALGLPALAVETAAFYGIGVSLAPPPGYRAFLNGSLQDETLDLSVRGDLALAAVRHGLVDPRGEVQEKAVARTYMHGVGEILRSEQPNSRAVRYLRFVEREEFHVAGVRDQLEFRDEPLALAEAALEEGLIEDLGPIYYGHLLVEYTDALVSQGDEAEVGEDERRRLGALIERRCKQAIEIGDSAGVLEDAYRDLALAYHWQERTAEVRGALKAGIDRLTERLARTVREDGQNARRIEREREAVVKVMLTYARDSGLSKEEEGRVRREAYQLAEELTISMDLRLDAVAGHASSLLDRGAFAEAESALTPYLATGFEQDDFAQVATRVALRLGDLDEAKQRYLRTKNAVKRKKRTRAWLRELRAELERAGVRF